MAKVKKAPVTPQEKLAAAAKVAYRIGAANSFTGTKWSGSKKVSAKSGDKTYQRWSNAGSFYAKAAPGGAIESSSVEQENFKKAYSAAKAAFGDMKANKWTASVQNFLDSIIAYGGTGIRSSNPGAALDFAL